MTVDKKIYAQKTTEYILYSIVIIGIILSIAGNIGQRNTEKSSAGAEAWVSTTAAGYIISAAAILFLIPFFIKFNTSKLNKKWN